MEKKAGTASGSAIDNVLMRELQNLDDMGSGAGDPAARPTALRKLKEQQESHEDQQREADVPMLSQFALNGDLHLRDSHPSVLQSATGSCLHVVARGQRCRVRRVELWVLEKGWWE